MSANPSLDKNPDLDAWIEVTPDNRIVVCSGRVEIGQGITNAVARVVAHELDVELLQIDVASVETGVSPDEGVTAGSSSIQLSGDALRRAAATARRHLLALAATALDAEPEAMEIRDGIVRVRGANRSATFAELLAGKGFGIEVDADAPIQAPARGGLEDAPDIPARLEGLLDGSTKFVHDLALPGMVHARVVRPPHYHARLEGLVEDLVPSLGGASLVRDGSFLAVAHDDEWAAELAARRVAALASWSPETAPDTRDLYEQLSDNRRVSLPVVDGLPQEAPVPPPEPPAGARTSMSARYERPYQMHASLGPSAACAQLSGGVMRIWTHSQSVYPLRAVIAEALGMPTDSVQAVHMPGAGSFGHSGSDDVALDAAIVARALPGKPVLLKWTREDEHAWEPYGTCASVEVSACLDDAARVTYWCVESASDTHINRPMPGSGTDGPARLLAAQHMADALEEPEPKPFMAFNGGIHRNADPIYTFERRRIVKHLVRDLPLRVSALRSLGAYVNVFAVESFMDELAGAAGQDPVAFRLRHLDDARARAVIEGAANGFGWDAASTDGSRGRGIAFAQYKNEKAYCAVAVDLEVDDAAEVTLHRAVISVDAGRIVDPDGLRAQLEGAFVQAASWTLYEAVQYDAGGVTSRDWESYPILRFDNVPEIETVLIDRPEQPSLGAGEAATGPTPAAIANAIESAVGLRLRRLPFRPDNVRAVAAA